MPLHQYIERQSGAVRTEKLFADPIVRFLYQPIRENAPQLFRLLTGSFSDKLTAALSRSK
jgi:phosphatidylserine decarboxylase